MFFLKDLPTRRMMERYAGRYPEMDLERTARTLVLLREASVLIRTLDAFFQEHGLSQTRFLTLIVLDREEDRTRYTIADLLDRLDVSKAVMTTILRGLQADGLVKVAASESDRRAKEVAITDAGRARLARCLPGYFQIIRDWDGPV